MSTLHASNHFTSTEPPDFSLVMGGPLFQLLLRSRLATPGMELIRRRLGFITLVVWLPLLLLSVIAGRAWGGVGLPFLYDIEMQSRFLLALPLLIVAEVLVHRRLRLVVGQFLERGIITDQTLPKFRAAIASAMKLRNSVAMEVALLLLVFVGGSYFWSLVSGMGKIGSSTGTWYSSTSGDGMRLTAAGYWYAFFSRPLFQFMLVRWYFRLAIWARFLWQASRLELKLMPTHPDRAGGLEFLGASSAAFAPLLLAHGVLLAGLMANPILFAGAKLASFKMEVVAAVVVLLLIVLGPLLVFTPGLMRAKRSGLRQYGRLASRYVQEFDRKWVGGEGEEEGKEEPLLGSGDIQSLADLGNSFQVIRELRPFPFGKDTVVYLVVITLLPVSPLVLTVIPLEELITRFLRILS